MLSAACAAEAASLRGWSQARWRIFSGSSPRRTSRESRRKGQRWRQLRIPIVTLRSENPFRILRKED